MDSKKTFHATSRKEWRKWLQKNHSTAENIWLVYYKKTSEKKSVTYEEAVEEALCFGWIDSRLNKIDDHSYMQLFSPRKSKSVWAKSNKLRVEKLIASGLMTEHGLKKIESAKKDGSWSVLDSVEELVIPVDLKKAFAKKKTAFKNFEAFPSSSKKAILYWIESAKTKETRTKRVETTVAEAMKNLRANQWKKL